MKIKIYDKHVVAFIEVLSDAGSIPAISINIKKLKLEVICPYITSSFILTSNQEGD